jgi:hypothetical protein
VANRIQRPLKIIAFNANGIMKQRYEFFFLIWIVGGGVQTGSTRHVGHFNFGLLYLPRVFVRMENLME